MHAQEPKWPKWALAMRAQEPKWPKRVILENCAYGDSDKMRKWGSQCTDKSCAHIVYNIYIMATKGMYGLPQVGLIANKLLDKRLNKHGYLQTKLVPGLWKHETRPICYKPYAHKIFPRIVSDHMCNLSNKKQCAHWCLLFAHYSCCFMNC